LEVRVLRAADAHRRLCAPDRDDLVVGLNEQCGDGIFVEREIGDDLAACAEVGRVERAVSVVAHDAEIALPGNVGIARRDDAAVRLERDAERAETEAPAGKIGQHFAVGIEAIVERAIGVIPRQREEAAHWDRAGATGGDDLAIGL
jgi:hypothetical protein